MVEALKSVLFEVGRDEYWRSTSVEGAHYS